MLPIGHCRIYDANALQTFPSFGTGALGALKTWSGGAFMAASIGTTTIEIHSWAKY